MQNEETIAEGKFLRLRRVNGWEYVERRNASGVIAIVALTADRRLLLVEQYRPPLGANVIELPAGLAGDHDDPSENLETAAQRELLEETGYVADSWRQLADGPSSAGLTNEIITFYLATTLHKQRSPQGDGTENLIVHEIPVVEVRDWLEQQKQQQKQIDLKIYVALFWLCKPDHFLSQ